LDRSIANRGWIVSQRDHHFSNDLAQVIERREINHKEELSTNFLKKGKLPIAFAFCLC